MPDPGFLLLVLWGVLAGIDLVSFPQGLLGRPIVAASVAGFLAGDLGVGLQLGLLLELYALDVLPIGSARYPDYGPAAVVAAGAAILTGSHDLGPAALLGLITAQVAGQAMEWMRRFNGRRVRAAEAALAAGDVGILHRLQWWGLAGDMLRSATVVLAGLAIAPVFLRFMAPAGATLTVVLVAGGAAAAAHGLLQRAGVGANRRWAAASLGTGLVIAWLL
ncbi:MAG TPA: PTS sugar transporter subunit IIC [Gemmatimonadales bacterium]